MAVRRLALALLLVIGMRAPHAFAQPAYLAISNPVAGTYVFGDHVAPYGDDILVSHSSFSRVYLYDGDTGALLRTFVSPSSQADDYFGYSVAAIGTNVLIGAPYDDSGSLEAGIAYLFDGATGALLQTIVNPDPRFYDHFGAFVGASGADLFVGADGSYLESAKDAYLYDSSGTLLRTYTSPTNTDRFGRAMVDFGATIAIGAPGDAPGGRVYVYNRATGALLQTLFNPDPVNNQGFGYELAALGANLIVGSPAYCCGTPNYEAYLMDPSTGALLQTYPLPSYTYAVAVHAGNVLVGTRVGAVLFDPATAAVLRTFTPPSGAGLVEDTTTVGGRVVVGQDEYLQGRSGVLYSFCGGLTECGPCETCDASGACVAAPHPTCRAPLSGSSSLVVNDATPDDGDKLLLRLSGAFGDPPRDNPAILFGWPAYGPYGHDYTICMYDESGPTPALAFRATAPADGDCGGGPCWTPVQIRRGGDFAGYKYIDTLRTPDGLERVDMRTTSGARLKLKVFGKGANLSSAPLGMATPPLGLPLRVQVQNRRGYCWETTYTAASRNESGSFRARSRVP